MMPSYCITLQGSGSRWDLFKKRATNLKGLIPQRFSAVDCRQRKYERWQLLIDPKAYRDLQLITATGERERHDQLTPGAVGCYLSHLAVLRKAYALDQKRVLIFEDDAVPPPNLLDLLQLQLDQLDAKTPDWDMLLLGYLAQEKPLLPEPLRLTQFYRTHAYVINQQGMAKILALGYPLRKQYDSALTDWSDRIQIYGAVPQLVDFDETQPTTIQMPVKQPVVTAQPKPAPKHVPTPTPKPVPKPVHKSVPTPQAIQKTIPAKASRPLPNIGPKVGPKVGPNPGPKGLFLHSSSVQPSNTRASMPTWR